MCPRRFRHKHHVVPHERTHTGEKPYACSMCPMRFAEKSHVVPHERTHTGEKPYACSICQRRFTCKSDVVRHEQTHRPPRVNPTSPALLSSVTVVTVPTGPSMLGKRAHLHMGQILSLRTPVSRVS